MKKILVAVIAFMSVTIVYSEQSCNTTASQFSKNCEAMYSSYKDKYQRVKVLYRIDPNLADCTKHVKDLIKNSQNQVQEKCDYKIIDFVSNNTLGLACKQVVSNKPFLFKSEFCKLHVKH